MLQGLKIENGVPFILNEKTNYWDPASITSLSEMEELLERMKHFDYPKETKRENIILEEVFDIGSAKVRSFQDEDGDLTVMFQNQQKNLDNIDEDAAFGLVGQGIPAWKNPSADEEPNLAEHHELITKTQNLMTVPFAGAQKPSIQHQQAATEMMENLHEERKLEPDNPEGETVEMKFKRRKIGPDTAKPIPMPTSDTSDTLGSRKRAAKKSVPVPGTEQTINLFKKRPPSEVSTDKNLLRKEMNTLFLRARLCNGRGVKRKTSISKKAGPKISFLSKKIRLLDSVFMKNIIRFNKVNKIKGGPEERFFLIPLNDRSANSTNGRHPAKFKF